MGHRTIRKLTNITHHSHHAQAKTKNNDNNKDDELFSRGRILKNLHLLPLDHPESCTTEHADA
eukprot:1359235-Ditylum_brightwellii.AAC.1